MGHARVHTLAPGRHFWIWGGTVYADGTSGANFFAGNVGIGTTNPAGKLTLSGAGGSASTGGIEWFSTGNSSGYSGWGARAYVDTPTGGWATAPFVFAVPDGSGNEIKTLSLLNGNVGIGTNDPSESGSVVSRLTIRQNEGWTGLAVYNPTGGRRFALNPTADGFTFYAGSNSSWTRAIDVISSSGNVGIGEINPQHKLAVNGTIKAKEIIVETTGWSDYVFADDYKLASLDEVEAHIKTNKHLPGIPSAAQVAEKGVNLGDMQAALLAKIEEITLHQIAQQKELSALKSENAALKARVQQLEAE
jgi:hypothetical protein